MYCIKYNYTVFSKAHNYLYNQMSLNIDVTTLYIICNNNIYEYG